MRSVADRIRHAVSFEIIGLLLVTPLGALAFGLPVFDVGVIAIGSATLAMAWNYLYNWLFDHALMRLTGTTAKTVPARVGHAVLFQVGLVTMLIPPVAWYLGIGLWDAFVMDAALALFYMGYAFAFNIAYDRLFPLPEWQRGAA